MHQGMTLRRKYFDEVKANMSQRVGEGPGTDGLFKIFAQVRYFYLQLK